MRDRTQTSSGAGLIVAVAALVGIAILLGALTSPIIEILMPGAMATVAEAGSPETVATDLQNHQVDDSLYQTHTSLGWALLAEEKSQEAQAQFALALQVNPEGDEAQAGLEVVESQVSAPAGVLPQEPASEPVCHVVQRGDTLLGLARRFGTTVEVIKAANGLASSKIIVGQKLLIPISAKPTVCVPVCPAPVPTVCVPVCPTPVPTVCVPVCPAPVPTVCVPVCPAPAPVSVPVCPPPAPVCVPVCPPPPPICVPVCPPGCVVICDP